MLDRYTEHVMSFIDSSMIKPFNVVLDAGSGIAGLVAPRLFDRLPCKTTRLCFEVDGTFPNHEANPLIEENRRDITAKVIEIRRRRRHRLGRRRRSLLLHRRRRRVHRRRLHHRAAGRSLPDEGSRLDDHLRRPRQLRGQGHRRAAMAARALMNRVGHAFIKRRMREEDAIFGGEVTGHYYFRDNFYADNGFIPALLILELMSKKGLSLRDLLKPLRESYFISGEINTKVTSMNVVRGEARGAGARPTATATSTSSTASRRSSPTGTSTSGPPTPSRCCA